MKLEMIFTIVKNPKSFQYFEKQQCDSRDQVIQCNDNCTSFSSSHVSGVRSKSLCSGLTNILHCPVSLFNRWTLQGGLISYKAQLELWLHMRRYPPAISNFGNSIFNLQSNSMEVSAILKVMVFSPRDALLSS